MPLSKLSPEGDSAHSLDVSDFDLRLERYRIVQPKADSLMVRSLSKYGQLAPLVYCILDDALVLVDGFKRLRAARTLNGMSSLLRRLADERQTTIFMVTHDHRVLDYADRIIKMEDGRVVEEKSILFPGIEPANH